MNIQNGRVGLSREDLDGMRARGFTVSLHTEYYANGITASYGDVVVGLYNWLNDLDAYVGDTRVNIETPEQAELFLSIMDGLVALSASVTRDG